jgi:hypothetical protein
MGTKLTIHESINHFKPFTNAPTMINMGTRQQNCFTTNQKFLEANCTRLLSIAFFNFNNLQTSLDDLVAGAKFNSAPVSSSEDSKPAGTSILTLVYKTLRLK